MIPLFTVYAYEPTSSAEDTLGIQVDISQALVEVAEGDEELMRVIIQKALDGISQGFNDAQIGGDSVVIDA